MNAISTLLYCSSFLVLVVGVYAWQLTSSRPLLINVILSSVFLLVGAYTHFHQQSPQLATILPFFGAMLLGGRAIGLIWRSRKETDLRWPGLLVAGLTAICMTGAVSAYFC